jgi:coenzyme PQQ precursor peptide PqqA
LRRRFGIAPCRPLRYVVAAVGRTRPCKEKTMAWTTPTLVEICIGLEINGYLPAEF